MSGPYATNSDSVVKTGTNMIDLKRDDASTLYEVYERALKVLSEAEALLWTLPDEPEREAYLQVHEDVVIAILRRLRAPLVQQYRELDTERPEGPPDSLLDEDEQLVVAGMTEADIEGVDKILVGHCTSQYRKVAMIIDLALRPESAGLDKVPFGYLVQRVQHLVESGRLESQGNLDYARFSEVRLPT